MCKSYVYDVWELVFRNGARRVGCGGGGWLLYFFFSFGPGFGIVISTWLQRSARRAFRAKDERRNSPNCSEKSNHDSQHAFSGFCFQVSFLRKVFSWRIPRLGKHPSKEKEGGREAATRISAWEGGEGGGCCCWKMGANHAKRRGRIKFLHHFSRPCCPFLL